MLIKMATKELNKKLHAEKVTAKLPKMLWIPHIEQHIYAESFLP